MKKILIATTNLEKLIEIKTAWSDQQFEFISLGDIEKIEAPSEDETTIEGNALLKAKQYAQNSGLLCIADDSGFFVDTLEGWPGVHSARIGNSNDERRSIILEKMKDFVDDSQRTASMRCAIALHDPETEASFVVVGHDTGLVLHEAVHTERDFTFDPIFYIPELGKSYAEISIEEKNKRSHRGNALHKMKYILENNYRAKHIVVPVGLLIKDGKILMTKRNDPFRPEYHEKWEFPGGSMEIGETFEQNVIREVREEAGYDVEIVARISHIAVETQTYPNFMYQVYLIPFVCKILGGDGVFSDTETLEAQWFDLDDALNFEMIGENERMYKEFLPELKNIIKENNL
ncbi:MAG: NUDIX domain-containing protein [Candidatus Magasanikbacteria bacterium]|nr:NUDIX domain-containing protein [Candidatus Magasanikbacteria bacterium]